MVHRGNLDRAIMQQKEFHHPNGRPKLVSSSFAPESFSHGLARPLMDTSHRPTTCKLPV